MKADQRSTFHHNHDTTTTTVINLLNLDHETIMINLPYHCHHHRPRHLYHLNVHRIHHYT